MNLSNQYKKWGGESHYREHDPASPTVTYKDIIRLLDEARKEAAGKTSEEIATEWIQRHCVKFLQV